MPFSVRTFDLVTLEQSMDHWMLASSAVLFLCGDEFFFSPFSLTLRTSSIYKKKLDIEKRNWKINDIYLFIYFLTFQHSYQYKTCTLCFKKTKSRKTNSWPFSPGSSLLTVLSVLMVACLENVFCPAMTSQLLLLLQSMSDQSRIRNVQQSLDFFIAAFQ